MNKTFLILEIQLMGSGTFTKTALKFISKQLWLSSESVSSYIDPYKAFAT